MVYTLLLHAELTCQFFIYLCTIPARNLASTSNPSNPSNSKPNISITSNDKQLNLSNSSRTSNAGKK